MLRVQVLLRTNPDRRRNFNPRDNGYYDKLNYHQSLLNIFIRLPC